MATITQQFQHAHQLFKQGRFQQAGQICANILQNTPNHPESLLLTTMILNKIKNHEAALQYANQALIFHPAKYIAYTEKGIAQLGQHQLHEAEKNFLTSIRLNKKYEKSQIQLAICKKRKNEIEEAISILKKWLAINPNSISALNNMANLYLEQQKIDEAEKLYLQTIELNPNNAKALINLGYFQMIKGNNEDAEKYINKGLQITPHDPFAISKDALLKASKGKTDQAFEILEQATQKGIVNHEILNTYGSIFIQIGEPEKAKNAYIESLKHDPNHVQTMIYLGSVYGELSRFDKAAEVLQKAIELNPWNITAKLDLAIMYQFLKKLEESHEILTDLYEKNPENENILFSLARVKCDICDWSDRAEIEKKYISFIERIVERQKAYPFKIFNFNYYNISPQIHLEASKLLSDHISLQIESIKQHLQFTYNWPKHKKIRIGYISPDFRSHPIGQVFYHLFQYHNRDEFEVYAYSLLEIPKVEDIFRDKIKADVDHFKVIQKMSFEEAAKTINHDEIDILIDMAGYTTYSKPHILALRPAPIQILFMGQPDSSGANFIDYYVADKILVPEHNQKYYTEKILYLPTGYFGSPLPISDKKYTKKDFDIPGDAFVYCCFCNSYKYEPVLFSAWMEILKQNKNGILWINKPKNETEKNNILNFAKSHGVEKSRIYFAERLNHEDYMARYQICDLFLDTLHYSAGSTAISALMAGIPVLTTTGNTNAENMGAAICTAANLTETICSNSEEYINKATQLAEQPKLLKQLKTKLSTDKNLSLLFNVKKFAADFENELKVIHNQTTPTTTN